MFLRNLAIAAATACTLVSCGSNTTTNAVTVTNDTATIDGHPAWALQGNIYEVNVRQYTPEGTFNAFAKQLPRLKAMGVQTLWFMPINPISKVDRKGVLGSYYAVADYTAINPEFGTLDDWKKLVQEAHKLGFKVIIDWVPNHTGADHRWLTSNPDFYEKDSTGKPKYAFDWSDTRSLNYDNPIMADSMIAAMKYWITESNIDGFRCDVAGEVPTSFWKKCIAELKQVKNVFMLAEADKGELHEAGFDASYPWDMFATTKEIAAGKKDATFIDSIRLKYNTNHPANYMKMYFTSNHDENSWNKADYATMPGAVHAPFAVLTQTLSNSMPLIYSGQEEPFLDSISFFYKDTILFNKFERASFYQTLLTLRSSNAALAANASFSKEKIGNEKAVYAFTRAAGGKKILVITNLSNQPQTVSITNTTLHGKATDVFINAAVTIDANNITLNPWDYKVYAY